MFLSHRLIPGNIDIVGSRWCASFRYRYTNDESPLVFNCLIVTGLSLVHKNGIGITE